MFQCVFTTVMQHYSHLLCVISHSVAFGFLFKPQSTVMSWLTEWEHLQSLLFILLISFPARPFHQISDEHAAVTARLNQQHVQSKLLTTDQFWSFCSFYLHMKCLNFKIISCSIFILHLYTHWRCHWSCNCDLWWRNPFLKQIFKRRGTKSILLMLCKNTNVSSAEATMRLQAELFLGSEQSPGNQQIWHITSFKTGNCFLHSLVFVCLLINEL